MQDVIRIDSVGQYNTLAGNKTQHPLVGLADLSKAAITKNNRISFGFYAVFLKESKCGDLKYGCSTYDYEEGTLVFIAPGQVIGVDDDGTVHQPQGHVLLFHPDLIRGTSLGRHIENYNFFSYESNEALHLSDTERIIIEECLAKIKYELDRPIDNHSRSLIVNNIELFLNYSVRFYERQFITREIVHKGLMERFENLLNEYYISDKPQIVGLPSVSYFADELHLSANYFGDLVKKESGKTAQEYLHLKIMDLAKEKMFNKNKSISEIAYELGFKYPQHFSRSFKHHVGYSPIEYRNLN